MFPSLSSLQHYVEFDIHTITTLKELLGARSFGGSIGQLICHLVTFPASLGKLGLPFVVQTTSPTFFGCWALITFTFVIYF